MKLSGLSASLVRALAATAIVTGGLSVAFIGAPSHATTVLKLSVPEMVVASTLVVRARVLSVVNVDERADAKSARDGLFTDVTLEILETYAGKHASTRCKMRLIGGVGQDGIALTVPGMPSFQLNEEVVVFLENGLGGYMPLGLQQGVWRVYRTPVTPALVEQNTSGLLVMGRHEAGGLVPDAASHAKPRAQRQLSDLVAEIQASIPRE